MESELSNIRIKLEDFYGPIDLLLELAKERELDITELTVSAAIDQYITLLKNLRELNIDIAADFIYFASQILLLKAKSIVPYISTGEEEEEEDSASDLVRKLLEYKKFRSGMEWIESRYHEFMKTGTGPKYVIHGVEHKDEVDLHSVTLYNVIAAYARIKFSTEFLEPMQIIYNDIPIEIYITKIIKSLRETGTVVLADFFKSMNTRDTIGTVLALLELIKQEKVELNTRDEPYLKLRGEPALE